MRTLQALLVCAGWVAALCNIALPTHARAQEFPSRPIKLIVPFPAGGGIDVTARVVAQSLGNVLGQQILVQNQGGAGGAIATDAVAKAEEDSSVIVDALADVAWSDVVHVLDLCRANGIEKIEFAQPLPEGVKIPGK